MKLSIISTSHRKNSESKRVADILKKYIYDINKTIECFILDMLESEIPFGQQRKQNVKFWDNRYNEISKEVVSSDGFLMVVPEYGGMSSPNSKNFFLLFNNGELFHKPGLIVSISSGNGGAYPISELRSSSYKNSHIMWIPENIIIRNVNQFLPGKHGELIPSWIDNRINILLIY